MALPTYLKPLFEAADINEKICILGADLIHFRQHLCGMRSECMPFAL